MMSERICPKMYTKMEVAHNDKKNKFNTNNI
jgi:hypothetical protein